MIDKVECQICGKGTAIIDGNHLKSAHGMTLSQYRKQFPDAPYISEKRLMHLKRVAPLGAKAWQNLAKEHPEMARNAGRKGYRIAIERYPDLHQRAGGGNKGRNKSEECKRRMSEGRYRFFETEEGEKYLDSLFGERNPNWKGGVKFLPYPPEFNYKLKERIKTRDGHKCVLCASEGDKLGRLSVHHIDYDKNNCDEGNLVTLCLPCNSSVNSGREYWKGYFGDLIQNLGEFEK